MMDKAIKALKSQKETKLGRAIYFTYMNGDPETGVQAALEQADLLLVAVAAKKAEKELRGKLRHGETLHEVCYRARQILSAALTEAGL